MWLIFFRQVGQVLAFFRASRRHWLQKMWPHSVETMRRPFCKISEYPSMQIGQLTVPDGLRPVAASSRACLGVRVVTYTSLSLDSSSSSLLTTQLSVWSWRGLRPFLLGRLLSSTITTESLCVKSTTTGSSDSQVRSTISSPALSTSSMGSASKAISGVGAASRARFWACLELAVPPRRFLVLMVLGLGHRERKGVRRVCRKSLSAAHPPLRPGQMSCPRES